jgi:hypothetical protein
LRKSAATKRTFGSRVEHRKDEERLKVRLDEAFADLQAMLIREPHVQRQKIAEGDINTGL